MTNTARILVSEALTETAARWHLRLAEFGANIPEHEALQYREWLHASPDHLRASYRVKRALDLLNDPALDADFAQYRGQTTTRIDGRAAMSRWQGPAKAAMALAACLVMVCVTAVMLPRQQSAEPATILVSAAPGQTRSVTLKDGSRISLDQGSAAKVGLGAETRRLNLLRGQVRVAVAPDRKRPFTVTSGKWAITALGTEFNVEAVTGGVIVYLAHGSVAVADAAATGERVVTLEPGDMLNIAPDGQKTLRKRVSADEAFAWQKGMILMSAEPLGSAVGRLSRYGSVPFIVDDARVARMKISGVFHVGSREGVIEAIEQLLPVAIRRDEDGIHLACRHPETCS